MASPTVGTAARQKERYQGSYLSFAFLVVGTVAWLVNRATGLWPFGAEVPWGVVFGILISTELMERLRLRSREMDGVVLAAASGFMWFSFLFWMDFPKGVGPARIENLVLLGLLGAITIRLIRTLPRLPVDGLSLARCRDIVERWCLDRLPKCAAALGVLASWLPVTLESWWARFLGCAVVGCSVQMWAGLGQPPHRQVSFVAAMLTVGLAFAGMAMPLALPALAGGLLLGATVADPRVSEPVARRLRSAVFGRAPDPDPGLVEDAPSIVALRSLPSLDAQSPHQEVPARGEEAPGMTPPTGTESAHQVAKYPGSFLSLIVFMVIAIAWLVNEVTGLWGFGGEVPVGIVSGMVIGGTIVTLRRLGGEEGDYFAILLGPVLIWLTIYLRMEFPRDDWMRRVLNLLFLAGLGALFVLIWIALGKDNPRPVPLARRRAVIERWCLDLLPKGAAVLGVLAYWSPVVLDGWWARVLCCVVLGASVQMWAGLRQPPHRQASFAAAMLTVGLACTGAAVPLTLPALAGGLLLGATVADPRVSEPIGRRLRRATFG